MAAASSSASSPLPPPLPPPHAPAPEDPARFGAHISLIGDDAYPGEDKFLGGELAADGNIYGVPGSAKYVLKVDPRTDAVTTVGNLKGEWCKSSIKRGRFKWLRGALDPTTGDMFGVPSNGNGVLRISKDGEIAVIGDQEMLKGHWKVCATATLRAAPACFPACLPACFPACRPCVFPCVPPCVPPCVLPCVPPCVPPRVIVDLRKVNPNGI